ncbi:hypothetical protein [Beijerinckia indica]|uniref:Lipoprotein n=1 Tax=Beijerinckia indica subsp. indica (strain ATCC 9039 / DSM 1715 / NCIMB 8712) TaxID=395963 RepID=B2IGK0_BEII9|nr:hypothetical protein [Beijerinckia indica]ACB94382.1 conserved hypothetical protein [Beijerinckia indica subsp. indica ATCC 9039]
MRRALRRHLPFALFPAMRTAAIAVALVGLAGCGGKGGGGAFDGASVENSSGSSTQVSLTPKLASLLGLRSSATTADGKEEVSRIACPEVILLDGDAAKRVYASGEDNASLRYQVSINDAARECAREGDELAIKVGVRGKVLLGPVGSPGTFNVQLRVAIIDEAEKDEIFSKIYRTNVTIAPGQTEGVYTLISDVLKMEFRHEQADQDYSIKIALADGSASASAPAPRRKRGH